MKKRRYERFLAMTLSVILAFGIVNVDSLQIVRANTTQAEEIVAQPIEAVLPSTELGVQKENLKVEENPVEETAETKKQEIQAEGQSEEVVNQEAEETEKTNQETQVEDDPVPMGVSGQEDTTASEMEEGKWVYLSDMEWESATSGDAEQDTKPVQKNKPYSSGNNGQVTKISLKMSNTEIRRYFEKGLGTVAGFRGNTSQPSVIAYNLNGLNAKKFSAYLGIDRTAHNAPKHAIVDRIEIVVDNRILFNTKQNFNEVNYNTNAILAEFTIPENAQRLELKAYAGEKTWADEVVYADAKILVKTIAAEPEPEETGWTQLSDLEWVSATHGDAEQSKKVQKNKPFSEGNSNRNTKIRMKMQDGQFKTFEKGLGTIAGVGENPSVITYDLRGAGATRFKAYVGLDKTAENNRPHDHGLIDKIEVVVDNVIKFTTKTEYPEKVTFTTPAIPVDIEIPANAKKLEIKAYAGDKTWKDEVVYADAKIQATGTFKTKADEDFGDFGPEEPEFEIPEKRMEISNRKPLLMLPLYAHGGRLKDERQYSFWGDDTLEGKWQSIPDDLKPYTVIQLHPDDTEKKSGVITDFYEHFLEKAQNYTDPVTGENKPIPIMLTVYTAGNLSIYTSTHWLTKEWIDRMYQKYSCLKGVFSTESYWVWQPGTTSNAAELLKVSAKNGGYFVWSEQNAGASIEKAMGSHDSDKLRKALETYSDNFIFMYKNTPQGGGHDAPTNSYMKGLWLAGYVGQWGGLMDTWKWYETGKWKLFGTGNIGHAQPNRQWLIEPEAMLGMEAMNIYLNGGCVYNFEHPFYTYGVKDLSSPLFNNVIQEFFRYVIKNPAPSKDEVFAKTNTFLRVNYSEKGNGNFFVGLNTEMSQTATYTTGRYGIIPAVPKTISKKKLTKALEGKNITILEQDASELASLEAKRTYFNNEYPEQYTGDIFAEKLDNRWFVYNYKYNENVNQVAESIKIPNTTDRSGNQWDTKLTLEPHTFAILKGENNRLSVKLNNYRVNKDELWKGADNAARASKLKKVEKQEAVEWVAEHYIGDPKDNEKRTTKIEIKNLNFKPVIENVTGLLNRYDKPVVSYSSDTKTATILINSNGYVYFDVVPGDEALETGIFLSDLEWVSATHGDTDKNKTVQKDKAFTPGNTPGNTKKITLKTANGNKEFEKGLGTVAGIGNEPSVITYDLRGAGVTEFSTYIGIDRSATYGPKSARDVKIEVVVDDKVLYTTASHYENGIDYHTEAIYVNVSIPENAKKFELKAYAGEKQWSDEVVFANALFKANGKFKTPSDKDFGDFEVDPWTPQPHRIIVNNEHPLIMIPLYAHGPRNANGTNKYSFWGDDTLKGKWESIPKKLRKNAIIQLHPDDLAKRDGVLADFYEHFLKEAQEYIDPDTGKNEPIPIMLTVYTAGNLPGYTASHWITIDWIDKMYKKYDCLKGIFSTESYWVWQHDTVKKAAEYLKVSAKNGGYFMWSEQNKLRGIEKALGVRDSDALRKAMEKYSDYYIFLFKNTPQSFKSDSTTTSYMKGLWLSGYINQWGGLMDTWKWFESGKWKLFAEGNIGKGQPNRQWRMQPEATLVMEAMAIYLNGGCVYNFEHPFYTYGVKDTPSPLFNNVIAKFFEYVIDNPAPSKAEVLAQTKAIIRGNYSSMGDADFFNKLNIEMPVTSMYTTGRYGVIPAVPESISKEKLEAVFAGKDIEILERTDDRISTLEKRKTYFNSKYAEEYSGDIFAQKMKDKWFVYNYKYNDYAKQTAESIKLPNTTENEEKLWDAKITLEPHSFVILEGAKDKVSIKINNYRVNKDELWENATNMNEAKKLKQIGKQEAADWIFNEYTKNPKDSEKRVSIIELKNLEFAPVIENVVGLENHFDTPSVEYNSETKTAKITVNSNGYVDFDVVMKVPAFIPEPNPENQPLVPFSDILMEF